ncbi:MULTISPECIES: biotin transporter BioY [unclassified Aureimonas]|uniref:biotin transporter BioY n=1 Tax=unclassified Aureimonas TaxID=2615206 RepID=UPI0007021079|nr:MULTISPECIES: biotin transporter BioY [unclassified Aureimonas]KQT66262.1 biotin biosynthesis protein BioY [Aureimonas sp. Leaf427]KQT72451.1 biotin biosynthesis protein BioY [Aureimonas sp. Leaf460]
MQSSAALAPTSVFSPLALTSRSRPVQIAAVLAGTLVLALSSYVEVPMIPVPITLQTLAVTLIGALYGWRLGAVTIAAWLVEGALGLPVLAGGAAGAAYFVGPTGGYLFAFPIVGALVGWLAERGWNGNRVGLAFLSMLAGNALCLVLGAAWLAASIGVESAVVYCVTPFIVGGVLKSALGAALLKAASRGKGRAAA